MSQRNFAGATFADGAFDGVSMHSLNIYNAFLHELYVFRRSCGDAMCTIAAASTFSEPFEQSAEYHRRLSYIHKNMAGTRHSDHVALLNAFQMWEEARSVGGMTSPTPVFNMWFII